MRVTWAFAVALALLLGSSGNAGGQPSDRLARFGELARRYAGGLEPGEHVLPALFALVDDEILDSLRSGGPFASVGFIQERLDAFGETWGGAAFRVLRPLGASERAPLTLVTLTVSGAQPTGSLRIYGPPGPQASLLAAATHEGALDLHQWPASRDGAPQFLASWLGIASGRSGRQLQLELWRQSAGGQVARAWSLAELFPDGLWVSGFAVRRAQILIRYEVRYPGWKPGCDGQTEHEDTYQPAPGSGTFVLARRQVFNAWHRELQAAVTRFFSALAAGDQKSLAELIPDRSLRGRLPSQLVVEPACEQQNPDTPGRAVVAATEPRDGTPAPWSLWWSRTPRGWRLMGAAPVLQ